MIFPEKFESQHHDRFKAHYMCLDVATHYYYGDVVLFDTGELIVTPNKWAPDKRKLYKNWNVQIVSTTDPDCPALYLPGEDKPCIKAHLNHGGQQILWIDHDHKRAVSLERTCNGGFTDHIPERFRGLATVYYYGKNSPPLGGSVILTKPKVFPNETLRSTNALQQACRVWYEMEVENKQDFSRLWAQMRFRSSKEWVKRSEVDTSQGINSLTVLQRLRLMNTGYLNEWDTSTHTHFTIT